MLFFPIKKKSVGLCRASPWPYNLRVMAVLNLKIYAITSFFEYHPTVKKVLECAKV